MNQNLGKVDGLAPPLLVAACRLHVRQGSSFVAGGWQIFVQHQLVDQIVEVVVEKRQTFVLLEEK